MTQTEEQVWNVEQADRMFKRLGAVAYHDFCVASRDALGYIRSSGVFSRHYFNVRGLEIGMIHPEFLQFHGRAQIFDTPRVWGYDHDMIPIRGD